MTQVRIIFQNGGSGQYSVPADVLLRLQTGVTVRVPAVMEGCTYSGVIEAVEIVEGEMEC